MPGGYPSSSNTNHTNTSVRRPSTNFCRVLISEKKRNWNAAARNIANLRCMNAMVEKINLKNKVGMRAADLEEGDLLIHCGDFTMRGTKEEIESFRMLP